MQRTWRFLDVGAAAAVLAAAAFAEAPRATPTPLPATSAPRGTHVRVVLPSANSEPDPSRGVPLNPIDAVPVEAAPTGKTAPKNELVIAPIPISNPAIGSGLALAAVYTLTPKPSDTQVPPTTLGAGGFYTSNGSWAGAAAAKLYLSGDRYRITVAGGGGKINYDLFALGPNDVGVPISQEFDAALGEALVGLGRDWYAGVRASYSKTTAAVQGGESGTIPLPSEQLDVKLVSVGLTAERDSRDSVFYPTEGARLQFLASHSDTAFGSDFSYTKTDISFGDYVGVARTVVVALQAAGCYATDGAPFYDLCLFGAKNVLRGYTVGRYLDRWTLAGQVEGRWRFANRWITSAFVGAGEVQSQYPASAGTEVLPAGGIGVQWIAAPQNMITVRVDYAWGKDGSRGAYVSIGQAF